MWKSNHCLERKAGSGSPLHLMMKKRYETEPTKLSQNNPSFLQCYYRDMMLDKTMKGRDGDGYFKHPECFDK